MQVNWSSGLQPTIEPSTTTIHGKVGPNVATEHWRSKPEARARKQGKRSIFFRRRKTEKSPHPRKRGKRTPIPSTLFKIRYRGRSPLLQCTCNQSQYELSGPYSVLITYSKLVRPIGCSTLSTRKTSVKLPSSLYDAVTQSSFQIRIVIAEARSARS